MQRCQLFLLVYRADWVVSSRFSRRARSRTGMGGEGLAVSQMGWVWRWLEHGIAGVGNEQECCDGGLW